MNFEWSWTNGLMVGLQHEPIILTVVDEFEDEEDILVSSWNVGLGPVSLRIFIV